MNPRLIITASDPFTLLMVGYQVSQRHRTPDMVPPIVPSYHEQAPPTCVHVINVPVDGTLETDGTMGWTLKRCPSRTIENGREGWLCPFHDSQNLTARRGVRKFSDETKDLKAKMAKEVQEARAPFHATTFVDYKAYERLEGVEVDSKTLFKYFDQLDRNKKAQMVEIVREAKGATA